MPPRSQGSGLEGLERWGQGLSGGGSASLPEKTAFSALTTLKTISSERWKKDSARRAPSARTGARPQRDVSGAAEGGAVRAAQRGPTRHSVLCRRTRRPLLSPQHRPADSARRQSSLAQRFLPHLVPPVHTQRTRSDVLHRQHDAARPHHQPHRSH